MSVSCLRVIHPVKALVKYAELQTAQQHRHHDACVAGMARSSLHMGDTKQGRALALDRNSPQLCKECALILESQDRPQVAARHACCQHCLI